MLIQLNPSATKGFGSAALLFVQQVVWRQQAIIRVRKHRDGNAQRPVCMSTQPDLAICQVTTFFMGKLTYCMFSFAAECLSSRPRVRR